MMPILSTKRGSRVYCIWNFQVGELVWVGSRGCGESFDRADERGSSALWPSPAEPVGGWDDTRLIVREGLTTGVLTRADLHDYCLAVLIGDAHSATRLVCACDGDTNDNGCRHKQHI